MKLSNNIIVIAFLFFYALAYCQQGEYKPIANNLFIIERLNNQGKELNTFKCEFKQQKYMSYLEATVESKGKFILKNPNKIRWEYTDPYQYLVIINNGKLSFKSQNQNSGSIPKENKLLDQLNEIVNTIFNGRIGENKKFNTALSENNISYKLILTPKSTDKDNIFKEINLWFNKTSLNISEIQIIEVSGDYTTLSFEKQVYNTPISDSEFTIH